MDNISTLLPKHMNIAINHIGLDVITRLFSMAVALNLPIVSLGIGNGVLEGLLSLMFAGVVVYGVDPKPNVFKKVTDEAFYETYCCKPTAKTVTDLLLLFPNLVGNCILLINWSEPNHPIYDIKAVQLLRPSYLCAVIERFGAGGGQEFLRFLNTNCGLHCEIPSRQTSDRFIRSLANDMGMELRDDMPIPVEIRTKVTAFANMMKMHLRSSAEEKEVDDIWASVSELRYTITDCSTVGVGPCDMSGHAWAVATFAFGQDLDLDLVVSNEFESDEMATVFGVFVCTSCPSRATIVCRSCNKMHLCEKCKLARCVTAVHVCAHCGVKAKKRCGKCKKAFYCSDACQKAGWKEHKSFCANM